MSSFHHDGWVKTFSELPGTCRPSMIKPQLCQGKHRLPEQARGQCFYIFLIVNRFLAKTNTDRVVQKMIKS